MTFADDFGLFTPADDFGVLQSWLDSFSMDFTKDEKVTKPTWKKDKKNKNTNSFQCIINTRFLCHFLGVNFYHRYCLNICDIMNGNESDVNDIDLEF